MLDDQYLVAYEVGAPWYSRQKLIGELLLMRFDVGNTKLADVVMLLEDLMYQEDAVGIVVGGAFARHPRALARMYKQLGFVEEDSPTLVKWR